MSKQQTKFPDAAARGQKDDKCLYEFSSDSGFLSGDISEEIRDSGPVDDHQEVKETNQQQPPSSDFKQQELRQDAMFVDSGVCLTDSFSRLKVRGQNDFDKGKMDLPTPVNELNSTNLASQNFPAIDYYKQDEDGDTHLHTAIEEGYVEVALALIRNAPHPQCLETRNRCGQTPLHLAVATGQPGIARCLVVAGVKPCPRGFEGNSPLHIAAQLNDPKSVQALAHPVQQEERDQWGLAFQGHACQPCNFDQWNHYGQTCAHVAAMHGHIEVLKHLVWYGADVNAREGLRGYTALHYAVERRDEALVQYLLDCKNIDVDVFTYEGRDVLEVNKVAPASIKVPLRNRGVPSPYPSDDEDEFDSEEEMFEMNLPSVGTLVNATS